MRSQPLIECVPNVSEGQNQTVIDALADVVAGCAGVALLHVDSDPDHHRSVLSFAGEPDAVAQGAFALAEAALKQIDLRQHRGVHPRMGALDVLPFVPLDGATMDQCVALSQTVGQRIGDALQLPVYLYGAAASTPARRNLAHIRGGQFEGFFEKIKDPAWAPDFGPQRVHPSAGVCAVGARLALIAFNVTLGTDDVRVAQQIARQVRESSGGLAAVKALGFALKSRGIVQVSMNLTDYGRTSLFEAFERVAECAEQSGVQVLDSEIVGLVPLRALADTARFYLRLETFSHEQVLEEKVFKAF